ncbi:skin secretory protein xP2-like isoform X2 [Dermacentor albipictus]|uniref:skin secretory protein xP2-like isoform X2 n=1 Tax=Dermacentor albipictus TaxID=60249 RepID=UPI0038FD1126
MGLRQHHIAATARNTSSNLHRKSLGGAPDPGDALAPEGAPGVALDPEGAPGIAPDPGAEAVKPGSSPARGPAPGIADPSATQPGPTEFKERRKRASSQGARPLGPPARRSMAPSSGTAEQRWQQPPWGWMAQPPAYFVWAGQPPEAVVALPPEASLRSYWYPFSCCIHFITTACFTPATGFIPGRKVS